MPCLDLASVFGHCSTFLDYKIPSELLCAVLMNGEVGCAIIAKRVKVAFQPLLSSIRVNWEFNSSNCAFPLKSDYVIYGRYLGNQVQMASFH